MHAFFEPLLRWVILTAIGCAAVAVMIYDMKRKGFRADTRLCLSLTVAYCGCLVCRSAYDYRFLAVGLALYVVLLYASTQDVTYHQADNFLSIMILIIGIITATEDDIPKRLLAVAVVLLPQYLIVLATRRKGTAIGGADLKVSAASAFLLGFARGIFAFMLGLFVAVVTQLILAAVRRRKTGERSAVQPFPLIPYLSVGILIGYIL